MCVFGFNGKFYNSFLSGCALKECMLIIKQTRFQRKHTHTHTKYLFLPLGVYFFLHGKKCICMEMHKSGCHNHKNSKIWDNYNIVVATTRSLFVVKSAYGCGNYFILILEHNKNCLNLKVGQGNNTLRNYKIFVSLAP